MTEIDGFLARKPFDDAAIPAGRLGFNAVPNPLCRLVAFGSSRGWGFVNGGGHASSLRLYLEEGWLGRLGILDVGFGSGLNT